MNTIPKNPGLNDPRQVDMPLKSIIQSRTRIAEERVGQKIMKSIIT